MKDQYDHLSDFFTHGVCTKTRTIWFEVGEGSDTEGKSLDSFAKQLLILESVSMEPITIYMRNEGGEVGAGLAMYDLIQSSPCYITIIGIDSCSSMGSIVLQAADCRKLMGSSYLMIHDGLVVHSPNSKMSIENWRKLNDEHDQVCYDIYLKRLREVDPKFTLKRLKSMLICDTIFTAEKALAMGLIDEIVEKRNY